MQLLPFKTLRTLYYDTFIPYCKVTDLVIDDNNDLQMEKREI